MKNLVSSFRQVATLPSAYDAWGQGLNEDINGLMRQHLPKRMNFSKIFARAC